MKINYFLFLNLLFIITLCNSLYQQIKDPYKVLGLSQNEFISYTEIRSAYKNLVKKWHPDKNKNSKASEKFHAIVQAYKVKFYLFIYLFIQLLIDPVRKKHFDKYGSSNFDDIVS